MGLREDLENYFRTKNPSLIGTICDKMMQGAENVNGKKKVHSSLINAVALFIANQSCSNSKDKANKEYMDMICLLALKLNNETRWVLLNSIANELRYPNSHSYFFSCVILYLFVESNSEAV